MRLLRSGLRDTADDPNARGPLARLRTDPADCPATRTTATKASASANGMSALRRQYQRRPIVPTLLLRKVSDRCHESKAWTTCPGQPWTCPRDCQDRQHTPKGVVLSSCPILVRKSRESYS